MLLLSVADIRLLFRYFVAYISLLTSTYIAVVQDRTQDNVSFSALSRGTTFNCGHENKDGTKNNNRGRTGDPLGRYARSRAYQFELYGERRMSENKKEEVYQIEEDLDCDVTEEIEQALWQTKDDMDLETEEVEMAVDSRKPIDWRSRLIESVREEDRKIIKRSQS